MIGEPRFDHRPGAIAIGKLDDPLLDALQRARFLEHLDDPIARLDAIEADQLARYESVAGLDDPRLGIEHVEHLGGLDPGASADLEVVEVMSGSDLDGAGAELRVGMLVGDDRHEPAGDREPHLPTDQRTITFVLGMNGDGHVGKHRLRTRRGDPDRA